MVDLNKLKEEIERLRPQYERYMELSSTYSKEMEDERERTKRARLFHLEYKCKYEHPTYPDMGVEGSEGSAQFENKEEADELLSLLRNQSYYYGYWIKWEGPGEYRVEPSYKHDHDKEVVYMATFKKKIDG